MALNMETIEKLPAIQKILIVIGVIILVYVLFYFFSVSTKQDMIKKLDKDLSDLQFKVSQGKAVKAKIKEFEKKEKELQEKLEDAKRKLPEHARMPDLLETLSNLARGNNLLLPKFHPGKSSKGCSGYCNAIPIKVNFVGDYHDIAIFLDQVSKLERIMNVRALDLKPKGKKSKKLAAKTTIVTYKLSAPRKAKGKGKRKKGKKGKRR